MSLERVTEKINVNICCAIFFEFVLERDFPCFGGYSLHDSEYLKKAAQRATHPAG
jgi:hypothetical protein